MKDGRTTSEYELAAAWSMAAIGSAVFLLIVALLQWQSALVFLPAACVLIYMASVLVNNYSENRFRLKAQRAAEEKAAPVARYIGFGRETGDQPQEEQEDDGD